MNNACFVAEVVDDLEGCALLLRYKSNDGYSFFSRIRASLVVNRQFTLAFAAFRRNPGTPGLQEMREEGVAYLAGTPRSLLGRMEKDLVDRPWEQVHDGVQVKFLEQENEL